MVLGSERASAESFAAQTWALVVGVSSYQDPGLPGLSSPAADAQALSETLNDPRGCAVPRSQVRRLPATGNSVRRGELLEALGWLAERASPQTLLLFYFAGHGLRRDEQFYLCTSETSLAAPEGSAVSSEDLERLFRAKSPRGLLFLFDCCRSAGFAETAPQIFRQLSGGDFRILLSASRTDEPSWELRDGKGTLFTHHLLATLSGREVAGAAPGPIYFSDLLRHLQDRLAEDLESLYPNLARQEPVFAGVFSRDPLLFLHQQLTLSRVAVRTSRYSPAYLRRLVKRSIAGLAATVFFSLGTLYTFAEQHQFAQVDGGALALFQGYPGLSFFGFPRRISSLDLGPGALRPGSPLKKPGGALVASLQQPVLPSLLGQLEPPFRAQYLYSQGFDDDARREIRAFLHSGAERSEWHGAAVGLFAILAQDSDRPLLSSLLSHPRDDVRLPAFLGLLRLDRRRALPLASEIIASSVSNEAKIFDELSEPCDPLTQRFLIERLHGERWLPDAKGILDAALRTRCPLTLADVLVYTLDSNDSPGRRDVALFASLQYGDRFAAEIRGLLAKASRLPLSSISQDRLGHLFEGLRFAHGTGCPSEVLPFESSKDAKLASAAILTEIVLCPGLSEPDRARKLASLAALAPGQDPSVLGTLLRFQLLDTVAFLADPRHDRALASVIGDLEDRVFTPVPGERSSFSRLLASSDARVRAWSLHQLRRLHAPVQNLSRFFFDADRQVEEEAYASFWEQDAAGARRALLARMNDQSADFLPELLGRVPLARGDLEAFRPYLKGSPLERQHASAVLVLRGSLEDAVGLVDSPDPLVRRAALDHVGIRSDLASVAERVRQAQQRHPDRPHPIASLTGALAERTLLAGEITRLPVWAKPWRGEVLREAHSPEPGARLWLEQAVGRPTG